MKTRCNKCREKIDYGCSLCDKCKSKYIKDKKQGLKNKDAERHIKSGRWKKVREQILLRDKCCILCLKRGIFEYRQLQVHQRLARSPDGRRAAQAHGSGAAQPAALERHRRPARR